MLPRWLKALALAGVAYTSVAASELGPKDGTELVATDLDRVAVGDVAPDFSLLSSAAEEITLSAYKGQARVVLVFYRGHW